MYPNDEAGRLFPITEENNRKGQFDRTDLLLLKAIEKDPLYYDARYSLAFIYNVLGKYDTAIEHINYAIKRKQKEDRLPIEVYKLTLATSYQRKREYKKMVLILKDIIKNRPIMFEDVYVKAGEACFELEDFKSMVTICNKGIKAFPHSARILANLAVAYHNLGDTNKGIKILDDVSTLRFDNPLDLSSVGFAYCKLGKFEKGLEMINNAITAAPMNSLYYIHLAKAYQLFNNPKKSITILENAMDLFPLDAAIKEYKQEFENLI